MKAIGEVCVEKDLKINCIAKGTENYITFSVTPKNEKPGE